MSADNITHCPACQPYAIGKPTMREDWDLGICDGELYIEYEASCWSCKFHKKFEHNETIVITPPLEKSE